MSPEKKGAREDNRVDAQAAPTQQTAHERVYALIKEAIVDGTISGGTRITESAMAKRFGVSRTPVREAIFRLATEHLLNLAPHGGAFVPLVGKEDIAEAYDVRGALEGLAAKLVCDLPKSTKELRPLIHQVELAELALSDGDLMEVERHNSGFHKSLVDLSRNGFLKRQLHLLQPYTYFLRKKVIALTIADKGAYKTYVEHLRVNMAGHRQIVGLLEEGDGEKAQKYLFRHINEASEAMIGLLPNRW